MYIFTRYVVVEILKIFFLTLAGITLLVTMGMAFKEGNSRGCPPLVILQLMPYLLPYMLVITIPVSLLLAVSIVYGRMTGMNEIIALKSLGVSPMDVLWPAIVLALLFSIAVLYLQELSATVGRPNMSRIIVESVEEIAMGMLQKEKSCNMPDLFEITVVRVRPEDKMLIKPTIIFYNAGQKITIQAEKAKLETDLKAKTLNIKCWDSTIDYHGHGGVTMSYPGMIEQTILIPEAGRDQFHRDWVAMHEIPELLVQLKKLVWEKTQERELLLNQVSETPEQEDQKTKTLGRIDDDLKDKWWKIYRLQTEPYRRLSNGFTCLCFVLIGAPVSMLWRHTDILTNFFVCFLPILAIYYPLLMIGEDLTTHGKLPPMCFWMGNVVMIIPGIMLLKYVIKH